MKSSRGITVLEVLVITIGFFAVMLFLGSFIGHGDISPGHHRRTSAKNDTTQIATAIVGFYTEYGRFPWTSADIQDVGGPGLQALLGMENKLNPRQIVFLELGSARKGKGGLSNGAYVDPWGFTYKMKLDIDGDKRIDNVGPAFSPTAVVTNKDVAVWSDPDYHPDRPSPAEKKKRAVNSWSGW